MAIMQILEDAVSKKASDIFIVSGTKISYRVSGNIIQLGENIVTPNDALQYVNEIFEIASISKKYSIEDENELDFSFSVAGIGRFRANVYRQRGSLAVVLRYVLFELPDYLALNIPKQVIELSNITKGIRITSYNVCYTKLLRILALILLILY